MPRHSCSRLRQLLLRALILCAWPALAFSAPPDAPPRVQMRWTDTPPMLDGRLDEAVWQEAAVLDEFYTALPVVGGAPSQRTVVRLISDEDTLYIAVECYDTDPDAIVVNRMLRDDADTYWDDRVNFTIDTFLDRRNGYFFQVNPSGLRRDGLIESGNFEANWDTIWKAKARITTEGWFVELAIPYKSIAFDPEAESWGFNFSRGIRRNNEDIRWADPVPQRIVTNMSTAGFIDGMGRQTQGIGLDVVPGVTTRRVDDEIRDRHYFKVDPTFDAFYRLTPGLTGSLTVNTDFGETEVDERQVNLDRFALFFPEKRDFFLQDALIFDFGNLSSTEVGADQNGRPFFSRKIGIDADGDPVDIRVGAKVTGRAGPFNIGLLDAQVAGHTLRREPSGRNVPVGAKNLFVGRAVLNVLEESRVGVMVTNGDPRSDASNTLVGADFNYRTPRFAGTDTGLYANLWFQNSFTEGEDGAEYAYGGDVTYPGDTHWVRLLFRELQGDFNPALGFVNRRDIRKYEASYRYRTRPDTKYTRTLDQFFFLQATTDRDDVLQSGVFFFRPIDLETHAADGLEIAYKRGFERVNAPFKLFGRAVIPPGTYHTNEAVVEVSTSLHRAVSSYFEFRYGEFFSGERLRLWGRVDWRPNRYLRLGFEYDHNELWIDVQRSLSDPTVFADRVRSRIARLRLNVQFSPDVSWITFVQYDNASDQVGVNSRLRWIIEDGREIFIVFNQTLLAIDGDIRNGGTEPLAKVGWTLRF